MSTRRRHLLLGSLALGALPEWPEAASSGDDEKVLRLAFYGAETSFDPARVSDLYSRSVTAHIFEGLFVYDYLARPTRVRPWTAAAMPEASSDFRIFTVRLTPGILFADDPAFEGRARELVAQDYVYAIMRTVDPANISPVESDITELGIVGLAQRREEAVKSKKPFDYDRPLWGLRALDRYTLRLEVEKPRPRLVDSIAGSDLLGGVAREVVEHYGDRIGEHPVGTGPFRLHEWRRSSRIVLVRNPQYREVRYDAEPAADDVAGHALLARFKGRRLPLVDRVEISVIEESQPRWLSFLNRQIDALGATTGPLPAEFVGSVMPGGKLAANLARQGIQAQRTLAADVAMTYFNMKDPVVGGYTPDKVALRRAISLGYDVEREIRIARRGQAVVAQSPVVPHTSGYEPAFKSEMGDCDPARARALLDLHGYIDRDGDGWRERPDGQPLLLEMANEPDQLSRQYGELWQKAMAAIGLKLKFNLQQWPENMKAARGGSLMMWFLGSSASSPDGQGALARLYGPQIGSGNLARFELSAFDRIYERMQPLPDGPERDALFLEAKRLAVAYMPYKNHVHRVYTDVQHPWLIGYRRPLFALEWWHMIDIDNSIRKRYVSS